MQTFRHYLQTLENNLPNIGGDKYFKWVRNNEVKPNFIVAVNQIGSGGDRAGPQTAAFNLPNDENVVKEFGNKLVLLKNIQKLKFNHVLAAINSVAIVKEQQKFVTFNSFFTHVLCHEMVCSALFCFLYVACFCEFFFVCVDTMRIILVSFIGST